MQISYRLSPYVVSNSYRNITISNGEYSITVSVDTFKHLLKNRNTAVGAGRLCKMITESPNISVVLGKLQKIAIYFKSTNIDDKLSEICSSSIVTGI